MLTKFFNKIFYLS